MKGLHCGWLVLLIALLAALPATADKARSLYSKGQQAEAKQQYEEAYGISNRPTICIRTIPSTGRRLSAEVSGGGRRMCIAGRCCGMTAS